ncbi:MAG: UDP-N-acetylmuramate--L-alanine ligase [Planctomycetaceae bacterium]
MSHLLQNLQMSSDNLRATTAHLVGARGAGMKALGEYLLDLGWQVTGSDNSEPCAGRSESVPISSGHAAANLPDSLDVLVHTPAVDEANIEVQTATQLGTTCLSYPQMLGEISRSHRTVAVSGTHGKSTTTALLSWILQSAGLSPSMICGAELVKPSVSGWADDGDVLVAEACEYRSGFLHLQPEIGVLLGIEPDHFDCFENPKQQLDAFRQFAQRLPEDGLLVVNADCRQSMAVAESVSLRTTTVSFEGPVGWRAQDVCQVETGLMFRVCHSQHFHSQIYFPSHGRHQITNVLAAIAVAAELGVQADKIEFAIETFPGLRRRFEPVGTWGGVSLIDDYAHHPTAVTATIRAARKKYPNRRLVAVFEPHQYSRTDALFDDFVAALRKADEVVIAPIFAARESVESSAKQALIEQLASEIRSDGTAAVAAGSLDQVIATLDDSLAPGDVLLTMGAGNIDRIPHEFLGRFQRHSEAG